MTAKETQLSPISVLRSRVESLLLVSDEPISPAELAPIVQSSAKEVQETLEEIAAELHLRGSGIDLRERNGLWRFYTRQENSETVEAKILDGAQQKLSRAALETLAVVAYRQPVTRSQVAAVRGVNSDGVMRTLTLRGLIKEVELEGEENPTGAHFYETTDLLLEQLGIDSLEALPDLAPLLPEVESIESDY